MHSPLLSSMKPSTGDARASDRKPSGCAKSFPSARRTGERNRNPVSLLPDPELGPPCFTTSVGSMQKCDVHMQFPVLRRPVGFKKGFEAIYLLRLSYLRRYISCPYPALIQQPANSKSASAQYRRHASIRQMKSPVTRESALLVAAHICRFPAGTLSFDSLITPLIFSQHPFHMRLRRRVISKTSLPVRIDLSEN